MLLTYKCIYACVCVCVCIFVYHQANTIVDASNDVPTALIIGTHQIIAFNLVRLMSYNSHTRMLHAVGFSTCTLLPTELNM